MEKDILIKGIHCSLCNKSTCGCEDCLRIKTGPICADCFRTIMSEHIGSIGSQPKQEKSGLTVGLKGPVPLSRTKEDAPS
jgi:hypothetical protein